MGAFTLRRTKQDTRTQESMDRAGHGIPSEKPILYSRIGFIVHS